MFNELAANYQMYRFGKTSFSKSKFERNSSNLIVTR
jgi:hypothetical protein